MMEVVGALEIAYLRGATGFFVRKQKTLIASLENILSMENSTNVHMIQKYWRTILEVEQLL